MERLSELFIGDESDERYTSVPLICQHCQAQNGEHPREGANFTTAYQGASRGCGAFFDNISH